MAQSTTICATYVEVRATRTAVGMLQKIFMDLQVKKLLIFIASFKSI